MGGKGWAWTLGIIIFVLSMISNLIQVVFGNYSSAIGVVIDLGIIYYITRPHVKAYFGKRNTASNAGQDVGSELQTRFSTVPVDNRLGL